eukprot:TRINITY_DN6329_c0_g1_i1.p1 TRINITY_DN6329_c0_g1~~TRINITY_DN6329_c0_g1_i1.p1  ORF type:complete len:602 (-),score=136.30 TRINITY_DN6329_c0_g1_i1:212-2017(-)
MVMVSEDMMIAEKPEVGSAVTGANKRGSQRNLECHMGKRLRMDSGKTKQCAGILKKLMTHPAGWVFNQPVDPVQLKIPDYFSIISKPMDLGTIKSKLETKLYSGTQDFAADVRLTFSNAMRYNPPGNGVHVMAKELSNIFNLRWKSLDSKWRKDHLEPPISKKAQQRTLGTRRICHKTTAYCLNSLPRKLMTSADKQKLRRDLADISIQDMPRNLLDFLRRFGSLGQAEEKIEVDIDAFDEDTALELQRIVRNYLEAGPAKSADIENSRGQRPLEKCKGSADGDGLKYSYANEKLPRSPVACITGTCFSMNCQCSRHNDFTQASSSDVDSERSLGQENHAHHRVAFKSVHLTCNNTTTRVQKGNSDPDSDGSTSVVEEENAQPGSHPATPIASREGEEDTVYEEQLSPSKALRAAMLRSRFADTILKAQHKTLLGHGEKEDPVKMQQEKDRLERKHREEKERIEARVRAAEAAAREKAAAELKMQREREREAARIALQKMEKTVEIDENREILKDLERLGAYPLNPPQHHDANRIPSISNMIDDEMEGFIGAFDLQSGIHGNPLEQLGLFMKNEDLEDEEEAEGWAATGNGDVEEGEIGLL